MLILYCMYTCPGDLITKHKTNNYLVSNTTLLRLKGTACETRLVYTRLLYGQLKKKHNYCTSFLNNNYYYYCT